MVARLGLVFALLGLLGMECCWAEHCLVMRNSETGESAAQAVVVVPKSAEAIARYAAEELVGHIEHATGVRLPIVEGGEATGSKASRIYVGETEAAAQVGIDVEQLASEACVLRSVGQDFFIVGNDGPGDPLSTGHTQSGTLWGVYEILEKQLGVRWLWPGDLGTVVPRRSSLCIGEMDETILPNYLQRNIRPGLGPRGFATADERLAFSEEQREKYALSQKMFLRRHRMGKSPGSYFSQRSFGSGHSFHGWWEKFGQAHPEWFQQLPDGKRGPEDLSRPDRVTMCVSNPGLHRQIVALWNEQREKRPGEPLGLGVGENDGSAACQCAE